MKLLDGIENQSIINKSITNHHYDFKNNGDPKKVTTEVHKKFQVDPSRRFQVSRRIPSFGKKKIKKTANP